MSSDYSMEVYLAWRPMKHRLAAMAYRIENFIWGDARAQHTCLIFATSDQRLLMIEIDVGDVKHGIQKSMKLIVQPLEKLPAIFSQIERIGTIDSFKTFEEILRLASDYVTRYPKYHTLRNNCRTFIDYLLLEIPEIREGLPKKNGSVLEYYHAKAKLEHPGLWLIIKRRIQVMFYLHLLKGLMLTSNPFLINESLHQINRVYRSHVRREKEPNEPSINSQSSQLGVANKSHAKYH